MKTLALTLALAGLTSMPAMAQMADTTGTGGGPASAAKAPYTASTGATVPRPGSVNQVEQGRIDKESAIEKQNDKILQGICIGCAPK